jgi:hypothetical protein
MDDHHLSNITKLKKKTLGGHRWNTNKGAFNFNFNFNFFFKFCDMESLAKVSKDSKISQIYT